LEEQKEKSIVSIIQNMLSTGESADKILQTLKEMNIPEEQAKTLLMIAQTNTLSVLKGEVAQMVKEQMNTSYPELEKRLTNVVNDKMNTSESQITDKVLTNVKTTETEYQEKQKQLVDKVVNVSVEQDTKIALIKNKLNELGSNYDKLALGSTKSMLYLRVGSFVLGLALLVILIYKLFAVSPGYSIDYLIFYVILGLISAVLFVLALF